MSSTLDHTTAAAGPTARTRTSLVDLVGRYALVAVLAVSFAAFSLLLPETFFTTNNVTSILSLQSVLAILAVAVTLPLISGEFDLSVGANLGLGAILVTGLPAKHGLPLVSSIVLAILACTLVGIFNGVLVAVAKLNAFVVTLATSTALSGAVLWYTRGTSIFDGVPPQFLTLGQERVLGVPLPVIYLVVIAAAVWFVLEHTVSGRYLYAIGSSYDASRLSGLPVDGLKLTAFACAGLLAGVAGVVQSAELGSASPSVGPNFLLPAYAAAFLGATAFTPGSFNVRGTVVAVFVIAVGIAGLEQMGVQIFIEPIFTGCVLLLAVGLQRLLRRR